MANCINKNMPGYQTLKERSGVSELLLDSVCDVYLQQYGRLPHLDEIPESNSKNYIEKGIKLKKNKSAKITDILDFTGTSDVKEATIKINNTYTDQETTITPIVNEALVDITKRPTDQYVKLSDYATINEDINKSVYLNQVINKLQNLYGIQINTVTDAELASEEWQELMPVDRIVNAFVYNGQIYVNTDRASLDAPIHEMMHILVGAMRFTNPTLYKSLIDVSEQFENYEGLLQDFIGKTRNDANEEIFIQEVAKYMSGQESELSQLSDNQLYEIDYSIKRVLDTILMGEISAKSVDDLSLYNMSLKDLAKAVRASSMQSIYNGMPNDPAIHRMLNNKKADLIKRGLLEEHCE